MNTKQITTRILICLAICLAGLATSAQQHRAELPYRMVANKIIVDINIEGKTFPFVFDTGGTTALIDSLCDALNLKHEGAIDIRDVTGSKLTYQKAFVKEVNLPGSDITFHDYAFMALPTPSSVQHFGAVGLLGSDLWQNYIVHFDTERKVIVISSPDTPVAIEAKYQTPFTANSGWYPVMSLAFGDRKIDATFDSGAYGLLSLKEDDYYYLYSWNQTKLLERGFGRGPSGVGGNAVVVPRMETKRVLVAPIQIGAATLEHVITEELTTATRTLIGVQLLKYGEVTIDYSRRMFYFVPFRNPTQAEQTFSNIAFNITDGQLCVSTIWGTDLRTKIRVGAPVTRINGKPTGEYDMRSILLHGLPETTGKRKNELTIKTKNGQLTVPFTQMRYK